MDDFPYSQSDSRPNRSVEQRLHRFKKDLQKLTVEDVVWKHVLQGDCYLLDPDSYYELQSRISQHFNLEPDSIRVVGSGKLGFSIVADKRYRPFSQASDIDIAIISDRLFDRFWVDVVKFDASAFNWSGRKRRFCKYLFNGWIRPDALPESREFAATRDWWEFFRYLSGSVKGGSYKIAGGLYRTTNFLHMYQQRSVSECKESLELIS